MKLLRKFNQDPMPVYKVAVSVDSIVTQNRTAGFTVGYPYTVGLGQRLVITTQGVWLEDFEEPYQDNGYSDEGMA